jgi:hypothetical protein
MSEPIATLPTSAERVDLKKLQQARLEAGMTQQELAERIRCAIWKQAGRR